MSDQIFFDTGGRGLAVYGTAQTGATLDRIVRYMRSVRDPIVTDPVIPEDPPVPGVPSDATYYITDHTAAIAERTIVDSQSIADWSLAATKTDNITHVTHTVTLTSETSATRACTLRYRVPISRTGLSWIGSEDLGPLTAVSSTTVYRNWVGSALQEHSGPDMWNYPRVLWGAVQNSTTLYALCVDPLVPVVFEMEYSGITQELYVIFRLGFHTSQRSATVKFHTWEEVATAESARLVVHKLQKVIAPTAFDNRVQDLGYDYGSWSFGIDYAVTFPSTTTINDFGMRFWQGPATTQQIATLKSIGVYRIRYIFGSESQHFNFTSAQKASQSAMIAELQRRAAAGDVIAQGAVNAGVFHKDGNLIGYLWYDGNPNFVPNPSPNVLPSPNHFDAQFVNYQSDLLSTRNGLMIDNNPFFYWSRLAPVGQRTKMNYREDHYQYMDTPLSFDKNYTVGIHYEMMAAEFVKACATWCKAQEIFQIVHTNGVPTANNFTFAHQDSSGWEGVAHYTDGRWTPTGFRDLILHRVKAGPKQIMTIINPQSWNTWTNSMTRRLLARFCTFGILPSMGRAAQAWDNSDGGTSFFSTPNVDRDRALFKQYVPITRTLAHAGWEPVRNFTLSNSTIWGERFGDLTNGSGTVYITCFNPSTTTNITFTLSSSTYAVPAPATFTELISNTSRSWTSGNLTITLGPETVQVFRLTYP